MRLFFAIIIALSSAFTFTGGAEFSFTSKTHDFPDAKSGEVLEYEYKFINTGSKPLLIAGYNVACSCTKITWVDKPVLPNETGSIHLSFDTAGKYGFQHRKIELLSNANQSIKLSFKVFVHPTEA